MIEEITKHVVYLVDTDQGDWPHWRTNKEGTYWENLMGMSWEQIDPPEELVDEFRERMLDWIGG